MDIRASTFAKEQIKKLDFRKAQAVEAANETGRVEPVAKSVKLVTDQVERATRDLIENFVHWEQGAHDRGHCPIQRMTERSASQLRTNAVANIRKAARIGHGAKDKEWWKYVAAASDALASAWFIEWSADKPKREKAEHEAAQRERATHEHEQALKLNTKRVSELHSIIRDGAAGEKLLAELYRALIVHDAAEAARKELLHIKGKAEAAAIALAKKAPVIDIPTSANVPLAEKIAHILHMATAVR